MRSGPQFRCPLGLWDLVGIGWRRPKVIVRVLKLTLEHCATIQKVVLLF